MKARVKKDYYSILGIHPGASVEQIRKSYRGKMLKYHPDRHGQNGINRQTAHKMAIELNEAYAVLSDKDSRAEYDSGYSQNQDERRRAAEEERIREEEERRRENEQRIRAEEQRKREEEARIRAEEKRRRDEDAERERVRLERKRRIAEEARKKDEQARRRMDDYSFGLITSFASSLIFGLYAFILLKVFSERGFMATALISAGISVFLMWIDWRLYSKMEREGEDVPFSLWLIGKDAVTSIYMPSTPATFCVAFLLYYPLLTCILCGILFSSGIGILGVIVIALIVPVAYVIYLARYLRTTLLSLFLPVRDLYEESSFCSRIR